MSVEKSGHEWIAWAPNTPLDNVSQGLVRSAGLTDAQIAQALA